MAEYIDKDIAVEKMVGLLAEFPDEIGSYLQGRCVGALLFAPAADVAEVKHGRWIYLGQNYYTVVNQCSECEAKYNFCSPYCPNCGARMDGGNNA